MYGRGRLDDDADYDDDDDDDLAVDAWMIVICSSFLCIPHVGVVCGCHSSFGCVPHSGILLVHVSALLSDRPDTMIIRWGRAAGSP